MIEKLISGGQVGADIAGLRAARNLGIPTGGTCPKGWRTIKGSNPDLANFGVIEHESWNYPPRTRENVRNSDGTIRFAYNWDSPGERATLREIKRDGKPYLDVTLTYHTGSDKTFPMWTYNVHPLVARKWLRDNDIRVLNVAGNGDERIEYIVMAFLTQMLEGEE